MAGGWRARWHRAPVWPSLLAQRLGLHCRVQARLFWGDRMLVVTGETVSRGILGFGYAEDGITALLCDLVEPGSLAVDIGAHFGYESLLMSRLTGPSGSVHSFEPNPEVCAFAALNLSCVPWARLHPIALSDHAGRAPFGLPPLADSAFGGLGLNIPVEKQVEIELNTLDAMIANRTRPVAVIKCDAEGHELAILRGAMGVIGADRPALILETGMPRENGLSAAPARDIEAQLECFGYRAFTFDFTGELRVGPLDSFQIGHASTLYLAPSHRQFHAYAAGYRRPA